MQLDIKLDGKWRDLNRLVSSMGRDVMVAATFGTHEFAKEYEKEVKKNIRSGGVKFGYPPLSTKYQAFKSKAGGGKTPFIWTKALYNAVTIHKTANYRRIMVGIPAGVQRPAVVSIKGRAMKHRLPVDVYAKILEQGEGKIPPRPIFMDTFISMGGIQNLNKKVFTRMTANLLKHI
jgi:hypothetical protein